jgi:uncharacterized membrane protein YfcA
MFLLPPYNSQELHPTLIPIATSLFAGTFATITSSVKHLSAGNVCFREAIIISASSILSAYLFPKLVVNFHPVTLRYIIMSVLVLVALNMAFKSDKNEKPVLRLGKRYLIPAGILTGVFSAMTGLGGGIVIVPALIYIFGVEPKRAIGTSVLIVAFTMFASSLSYATISGTSPSGPAHLGYINIHAGLMLGISAVFGAILGAKLHLNIKTARIKKLFSIFILIVIIKMLLS